MSERVYSTLHELKDIGLIEELIKAGCHARYKPDAGLLTIEGKEQWMDLYVQGIPKEIKAGIFKNTLTVSYVIREDGENMEYYLALYKIGEGNPFKVLYINAQNGSEYRKMEDIPFRQFVLIGLARQKVSALYNILKLYGYRLEDYKAFRGRVV